MQSFNDTKGRVWNVSINVTAVKRVKELLEIDLMDLLRSGDLLEKIAGNDVLMVDTVFAICKPQADALNVSSAEFGECMAGQAIAEAYACFIGEISNFFRNPNTRRVMGKIWNKVGEVENYLLEMTEKRIDSGEVDLKVKEALAKMQPELTNGGS